MIVTPSVALKKADQGIVRWYGLPVPSRAFSLFSASTWSSASCFATKLENVSTSICTSDRYHARPMFASRSSACQPSSHLQQP